MYTEQRVPHVAEITEVITFPVHLTTVEHLDLKSTSKAGQVIIDAAVTGQNSSWYIVVEHSICGSGCDDFC